MENYPYMDKNLAFEERAKDLVSRMTLEERAGQTVYNAPTIPRLNVKAYNWWNEALHGVARAGTATVFPQAIALAASFDEDLMESVATVISDEGRAKFNMSQEKGDYDIYKGLTFWAPNINIFRDPRWGRGHETYGEDPYLTSRLACRFIKGLQGSNSKYLKTAACAKHFAVHSGPEDQRHSFDAAVGLKDLYETYLPAFEACVREANVEAVMGAYNRTNGEPCCGSKTLLVDILRGKWGFKGHVVSDCWAIKDFHDFHKITDTPTESAALAIKNGCDMNCGVIYLLLIAAYQEGLVSEGQITAAAERVMLTRMKLGHFDDFESVPYNKIPYSIVDCKEHSSLNFKAAQKSIVLLKNNILPLDKSKISSIGVIGPNANSRDALVGNYEGTASRYVTILEGIQDYVGGNITVRYSEGCHLYRNNCNGLSAKSGNDRLAEALAVAEISDIVVLCMGLDPRLEGEQGDQGNEFASGDKISLNLPGKQIELIEKVIAVGKPVILISVSGSAVIFGESAEKAAAIIQAFYPGAQGGKAVASILFGDFSPEGKLPVTFYKTTEELPDFTDYNMENRTYRYMKNEALYPFGFGLSYTKFAFSDFNINAENPDSGISCSVKIKNTGNMKGSETIQLYIKANMENAPNYQLKKLKKVLLNVGEEQTVDFILSKKDFSLYGDDGELKLNDCSYEVFIGASQPDKRSTELMGCCPLSKTIEKPA